MPAPSPRPLPRPARRLSQPGAAALAAVLALAAVTAPAEGQLLKRLKQAAQDKVAGSVTRAAGGDAAAAASASRTAADAPAERKAPAPITAERLDVFLAAMRPAIDAAERGRAEFAARKAYDAAVAAVAAHNGRIQACAERVMVQERPRLARLAANPAANADALQRLQGYDPRSAALTAAVTEAAARQDYARLQVLEDSAAVLRYRAMATVVPALTGCGIPKSRPAEPKKTEAPPPEQAIAPPAGMTRAQFGRLRERVALYALTGGKDDPFTAEERAVLDARAADLARLAPLFRDGLLEWGQWGAESNLGRRWNPPTAGAGPGGA